MKKSYWKPFVALLLTVTMLIQTMSLDAYATILTGNITSTSSAVEVTGEQASAEILGEVEEQRGEREKHFRLSDGSFIGVSYDEPVHYRDSEGKWQEIDNSLVEKRDRNGNRIFMTRNAVAPAAFAADLGTGGILTSSVHGTGASI